MNTRLNLGITSSTMTVGVAALATVISIGILALVVHLFQSRGAPMERLAAAERACQTHAYVSKREACMKQWLAQSRGTPVAAK